METVVIRTLDGAHITCEIDKQPHECPHCHRSITPRQLYGINIKADVGVTYQCPDKNCEELFIAYYKCRKGSNRTFYELSGTSIGTAKTRVFSEHILEISKPFAEIYNQSLQAEVFGLNHICGIGYRKALEFLIKDFVISLHPDKEEIIKSKYLGNCIKDYIKYQNLKDIAERAAWLGNDETHYSRKWNDKDVKDLKILIDVTVHWVEMEFLTAKYKASMPA